MKSDWMIRGAMTVTLGSAIVDAFVCSFGWIKGTLAIDTFKCIHLAVAFIESDFQERALQSA